MLTQSELKQKLHYSPETEIFTRFISNNELKIIKNLANSKGYIEIRINGIKYKSHRLAWLYVYGNFPNKSLDHINGIKTDNRIKNLREANQSENLKNIGIGKNNTSGIKGASFDKNSGKWKSQGCLNYKKVHIGLYESAEEAGIAYLEFAKKYHGEFYKELHLEQAERLEIK